MDREYIDLESPKQVTSMRRCFKWFKQDRRDNARV